MSVHSLTQSLVKFNTINPGGNELEIFDYIKKILKKNNFKFKEFILEKIVLINMDKNY